MERQEFIENLKYLELSETTAQAALSAYEKHKRYYLNLAARAYEGERTTFPIRKARPLDRVVLWVILLTEARQRYIDRGIPEDVIHASFDDIKLLTGIYEEKYGKPGLTQGDASWFRLMYFCQIFKLGSLQFQLNWMGYPERLPLIDPEQKTKLPPNSPVIAAHIQAGADMSEEAVKDAFARADRFFPRYFADHGAKAYVCSSWLLYEGMRELLPAHSKILGFGSQFCYIGGIQDAFCSDAVNRIYGKRYKRKADYPQNTSLQRKALHNFDKLGIGFGVREIS